MASAWRLLVVSGVVLLASCGLLPSRESSPGVGVAGPAPAATAPVVTGATPLAWEDGHPERVAWSTELRSQVSAKQSDFDRATDWTAFCPAYYDLPTSGRREVIATLAVAIARDESGFDAKRHEKQGGTPEKDSVGLFQLSYADDFSWCSIDPAGKSLEDPLANIRCAVPQMSALIARDGVVSASTSGGEGRGLARYWPAVRPGGGQVAAATKSMAICK